MNVTRPFRTKRSAEFSPVRPGLRYGSAPLHKRATVQSTALDRWVLRSRSRLLPKRYAPPEAWLQGIRQRVADLSTVREGPCHAKFKRLTSMVHGKGHTDASVNEALANAVYVARQTLGLVPHDAQLVAARELLLGRFVEMGTGEGKTLTMALASAVSAFDGTPVHVLTASEYLAQRDAQWLTPFYNALGLSVACVLPDMTDCERRNAYCSDVVHVTGKQVAFDWLRDNLAKNVSVHRLSARLGNLTQVDDESDASIYEPLLRGLCLAIIDEADSLLIDEARTPLVLAAPIASSASQREECVVALTLARLLHEGVDFIVSPGMRTVELTSDGEHSLDTLSSRVDGLWRATRYRDEKVRNALSVLHCWRRDRDYVVREHRIELVDSHTGRALPDRRLQNGLHTLLELKERCEATPENDVVASLPFQSFFMNYVRLCGMSGTLREVRAELACVYGVDVICVAPVRSPRLQHLPSAVFATTSEQVKALIDQVRRCLSMGRPVLVGTRTVEQSIEVSNALHSSGINHKLLNAEQDTHEASVVALAGNAGQVTVATNMAGRGTDIRLGPGVRDNGGLHVISLAFNDSSRLDRQLAGRAGRQGDPGSSVRLLSVEDTFVVNELPSRLVGFMKQLALFQHKKRSVDATPSERKDNIIDFATDKVSIEFGKSIAQHAALLLLTFIQRKIEHSHAADRQRALDASRTLTHHIAIGGTKDNSP